MEEAIVRKGRDRYLEFEGVRITPKALILKNAYEGKFFREKILLQNVSYKPVTIRTRYPSSFSFNLENCLHGVTLSCGLTVSLWINFTFSQSCVMQAQLPIIINDNYMNYNIQVFISSGHIFSVPRFIDYGTVNAGYSVHLQTVVLHNQGYKMTKFEFDLADNELDLIVKPLKGFIPARGSTLVEIDFIGFKVGKFVKEVWIKCDHPFRISVTVNVITPILYVIKPDYYTESFTPIMFPPIYGACKCTESCVILNYNTLKALYIIVPELNTEVMCFQKARLMEPMYDSFHLSPIDGYLEPNEQRALKISFEPRHVTSSHEKVFFVFYRVIRLESMNVDKMLSASSKLKAELSSVFSDEGADSSQSFITEETTRKDESVAGVRRSSKNPMDTSFPNYIRLCLYSVVKPVEAEIHPSFISLGTMLINSRTERTLVLRNSSKSLPIYFQYKKVAFIDAQPPNGHISCAQSININVTISPKAGGTIQNTMHFELLYLNQPVGHEKEFVVVGNVEVQVGVNVLIEGNQLKPLFNPGIVPKITNEVGLLTNDIRFNTAVEKPRMAMVQCARKDDALVAFPNDLAKSLRPWREQNVETIFAAMPRLITQDDEYTLPADELARKQRNTSYYSLYIDSLRRKRLETAVPGTVKPSDYEVNGMKLLGTVGIKTRSTVAAEYTTPVRNEFPLLTPIQIFFVKVKPTVLNVGKVLVSTKSRYKIYVKNENQFRVKFVIRTHDLGDKSVFPNLPQHYILEGNTSMHVKIDFEPTSNGRFNTILNAYLNLFHVQPILFQADVVLPTVTLESRSIEFDDINRCRTKHVNVCNTLNESVSFTWSVPAMCCFSVEPVSGTVLQNRYIACQLSYTPDPVKRVSGKLSVTCENGNTTYLDVTACLEKAEVGVVHNRIHVAHMPLNIVTRVTNTLRNYEEQDVIFSIRNPKPLPGVRIKPASGTIRGRSDVDLTVSMLFKAIVKFECTVDVEFEMGRDISFRVSGCVDYPHINFKPSEIQMKRIPAESFDIVPFAIENNGHSDIEVTFLANLYPELRVSHSTDINTECYINTNLRLKPRECVPLYLHFFPLDVCMNSCCLPIVINGILGPPMFADKKTHLYSWYLDNYVGDYDHENIEHLKERYKMHTLNISTISTRHVLRFSKTFFKFKYHPNRNYRSFVSYELRIKNDAKNTVHFMMNVKDLRPHFDMFTKYDRQGAIEDDTMSLTLGPEGEITLNVNFVATTPGEYSVNVPVYLKGHNDGSVFNYLQLRANYHSPKFSVPSIVHLQPVPTCVVTTHDFMLTASYHYPNCSMQITSDLDQLKVILPDDRSLVSDVYMSTTLKIKLRFSSYTDMEFTASLTVSCTCGAQCKIPVTGCTDNSVITSYAYNCMLHSVGPDTHDFPLFPAKHNKSEFSKYMHGVLRTTEQWLFHQVFYRNFQFFIPSSMNEIYRHGTSDIGGKRVILLVKILVNVCGHTVLPFLINRDVPEDETERVNHYHSTYRNALSFLKTQKANMPHVRARYLLTYPDYVLYMSRIRDNKQKSPQATLDKDQFYQTTTQCWLDLLLQIFKTMILARVSSNLRKSCRFSGIRFTPQAESETVLLSWCSAVFNRQLTALMDLDPRRPERFVLESRTLTNFTTDFSDALVLIAVTIEHCPYLGNNLRNIYVYVDSPVKAFHNAALLQSAWALLRTSCHFSPNNIVHPCPVHMLMLLTYMHDAFPNLVPKDEICFRVNLSSFQEQEVTIKNPNAVDIFYEVQFLNNELNCFSIRSEGVLRVNAGKSLVFKIRYQARKMFPVKGVILFSGDTPRQVYSKSIVYSLTGEPNFASEFLHLNMQMNLYTMLEKIVNIATPYPVSSVYDIRYTYTKPNTAGEIKLHQWKDNVSIIRPRVVQSKSTRLKTDDNGIGNISIKVFCLSAQVQDIWFFFSNRDLGDFFVKMSIQPTRSSKEDILVLPADLPADWATSKCICKLNKVISPAKCPRRLKISIPSKNDLFWHIVAKSLLYSVPPEDRPIWMGFIESEMGPYLIKWLVADESSSVRDNIFDTDIKYKILNPNVGIQMPSHVTIGNIRSPTPVEIWMHVREDFPKTRKFVEFSLQSELGTEIRIYKIAISGKPKKPSTRK